MTRSNDNSKLFAFGALALLAFAAVPAQARLGAQSRGLQAGGLLGSIGEGVGKGLAHNLGGAIAGTCDCAHGYGALSTCKPSSFFAGNGGLQAECTKQTSKGACTGQENLAGKSFCKWTPSKLSGTMDDISKDLDPSNWGKALGLKRLLESNEVDKDSSRRMFAGGYGGGMGPRFGELGNELGQDMADSVSSRRQLSGDSGPASEWVNRLYARPAFSGLSERLKCWNMKPLSAPVSCFASSTTRGP